MQLQVSKQGFQSNGSQVVARTKGLEMKVPREMILGVGRHFGGDTPATHLEESLIEALQWNHGRCLKTLWNSLQTQRSVKHGIPKYWLGKRCLRLSK